MRWAIYPPNEWSGSEEEGNGLVFQYLNTGSSVEDPIYEEGKGFESARVPRVCIVLRYYLANVAIFNGWSVVKSSS